MQGNSGTTFFRTVFGRVPASVCAGVLSAFFFISPAFSAGPVSDSGSCKAALSEAEDMIVRANIESGPFRELNDRLVEMRGLCEREDFSGAQAKLLEVTNALKDLEKKS
jgi:hypothetical protein